MLHSLYIKTNFSLHRMMTFDMLFVVEEKEEDEEEEQEEEEEEEEEGKRY